MGNKIEVFIRVIGEEVERDEQFTRLDMANQTCQLPTDCKWSDK